MSAKQRFLSWLPTRDLRLIVLARGLRSLTQGFILVVFAIYLSKIGFSAWLIGITLGIGSAVSAVLTLSTGILSDRYGRKPFLLIYGILLAFSGLIFSITTIPIVLISVSALGGIGRSGGAGGQAGPFAPAETALISEKTTIHNRPKVFTVNTIVGTIATACGAFLAGFPQATRQAFHLSLFDSYKPFFIVIGIIGLVTFAILLPVTEKYSRTKRVPIQKNGRKNFDRIRKISIAGFINGFGLGFISSILPLWLYFRFHVSPGAIGPIIGISMLATSVTSIFLIPLARRFGDVIVISFSRFLSILFIILLAFSPTYPVAALFIILRMASAMSAMPIRQSYTMGIIDEDVRGRAAGFSGVARRLPAAVSPAISGYWLNTGELNLPLFASAFFMGINAILYFIWFRSIKATDSENILQES